MKKPQNLNRNFNSLKYALMASLSLFFSLSITAQEKSTNPLDNADKGLVFTQEQQNELTDKLTSYWTNKLTPVKTVEWNNKLTDKITNEWDAKLTEKLSAKIEEKITKNIKKKWDPILNKKYSNASQFYRQ